MNKNAGTKVIDLFDNTKSRLRKSYKNRFFYSFLGV